MINIQHTKLELKHTVVNIVKIGFFSYARNVPIVDFT